MTHRKRNLCARLAEQAVYTHQSNLEGCLFGEVLNPQQALMSLLVDLRHWADRERLDFNGIDKEAYQQYAQELFS